MAFIFPTSWDDDPIWLSYFSGGETTNQAYNEESSTVHDPGNGKHTTYKNGESGDGLWHFMTLFDQHLWK